jgi:hypothetical protein
MLDRSGGLDQAALDAVRQWQYWPAHLNGRPIPLIMTATVRFQLQQSSAGVVVGGWQVAGRSCSLMARD